MSVLVQPADQIEVRPLYGGVIFAMLGCLGMLVP